MKEWDFTLLTKPAWLFDHKLSLIRLTIAEREDLNNFITGNTSKASPAFSNTEASGPSSSSSDLTPSVTSSQPPTISIPSFTEVSLLDMPLSEKTSPLRVKR